MQTLNAKTYRTLRWESWHWPSNCWCWHEHRVSSVFCFSYSHFLLVTHFSRNSRNQHIYCIFLHFLFSLVHLFEVKAVPAVLAFRLMRTFLFHFLMFILLIIMFSFLCLLFFTIFRNGVVVDKFIGLVGKFIVYFWNIFCEFLINYYSQFFLDTKRCQHDRRIDRKITSEKTVMRITNVIC